MKLLSLCWKEHEAKIENIEERVTQLHIEHTKFNKDKKPKYEI